MKRAAIGVRMHSGWGALVAVADNAGTVEIVDRRRIALTSPGARGGNQPYHFAKSLELAEAEKFLGGYFAASQDLALKSVQGLVSQLDDRYRVTGSAILLASGRPLPTLSKILSSHSLIHTAEGEFFREAFSKACESLNLPVTGLRERHLDERVQVTFGKAATQISQQISDLGHSVGPPWTRDQKMAALAALVVLANDRGDSR
ncbi:MAG TPA: hypothetical protein VHT28_13235 [Silvibacterium sp.]|jgi:hypothetical protein|nr:hypothetical protein [Silvibacterium sp.]